MTSKIKKILGVMLALILIVSTGLGNANAATGEITVKGTTAGKKYSIYKIFDLTLGGENNDKVAYTISNEWKNFFTAQDGLGKEYIVDTDQGGLNPIVVDGKTKYINITEGNIADFAKAANKEIANQGQATKTAETTKEAGGDTLTFNNLDLGYYLVHPKGASEAVQGYNSVVSLTSTQPTAEINAKGLYPTISKEVVEKSYDYGDEFTYTLTGKVPDTTGYDTYKYTMTDTLSQGLTLNTESVAVTVGGQDLTESENVEITKEANRLVLDFKMKKLQNLVGQEIKVTYNASLNTKAVIGKDGNPNDVVLEYSNDPHNADSKERVTDSKKVYTGAIKVIKHDAKNENILLKGATFKLKNKDGKYYHLNGNKVEWVDEKDADAKTTEENGVVEFKGLENGTYFLVETEAPAGYNKLTSPVEVEVDYKTQTNTVYQEAKVANSTGIILPGTGGRGTTLFAVLGGGIILLAAYNLKKDKFKKKGTR